MTSFLKSFRLRGRGSGRSGSRRCQAVDGVGQQFSLWPQPMRSRRSAPLQNIGKRLFSIMEGRPPWRPVLLCGHNAPRSSSWEPVSSPVAAHSAPPTEKKKKSHCHPIGTVSRAQYPVFAGVLESFSLASHRDAKAEAV